AAPDSGASDAVDAAEARDGPDPRIVDPFEQDRPAATAGVGMALAGVPHAIASNGTLVDRQPPVAVAPAVELPLIAVVEDEPGVRTLVEQLLVRGGHRVLAFPDGNVALDALADPGIHIDMLITDLVMPGPSGIEVARRIRRDRPGLPVLLMSGYAADALRAER